MNQQTRKEPSLVGRWAHVALAVAAAAGALATAGLAAPSPSSRSACSCNTDEPLWRELAELRLQLEQLRFAVQVAGVTGSATPAAQGGPLATVAPSPHVPRSVPEAARQEPAAGRHADPASSSPPPGSRIRAYEHFDIPYTAVTIQQSTTGDLVIQNTDPSLAGQTIEVRAYTSDPAPQVLRIVVPPAEPR
jgi:hypothetical protein